MIPTIMKGRRHAVPVAILILLVLLSSCGDKVAPGTAKATRQAITGVTVAVIQPSKISDDYETSGTVKAEISSMIASRVMGAITAVHVRAGERVKAGQLLATIDDRDTAQKVRAAEQALQVAGHGRNMADLTYQRYRKLHDEKALAKQEIDAIETQKKVADATYQQALAGLEEARVLRGFTRITAPISGVVTDKRIDPGSMALPGMPLFTVETEGGFRVDAVVDESMSGKLFVGASSAVFIESLGLSIGGKIREIVPAVDPSTRTFIVKISLPDKSLRSGLFARVRLPRGEREALLVPKAAVVEKGQLTGLYTVDAGGVVTYRLVRIGKAYEKSVEILSGLNAGERILTTGLEKAVDGGRIAEGATR